MLGDKVAVIKEGKGLPTIDAEAEQVTMDNLTHLAKDLGINIPFARRL